MSCNLARTTVVVAVVVVPLAGLAVAREGALSGSVTGHAGPITITVSPLRAEASGQLTSELTVTNRGRTSDELDTAIANGGAPVSLAHDPSGGPNAYDVCGGVAASAGDLQRWMRDGPLLVPNPLVGRGFSARATVWLNEPRSMRSGDELKVTFYFARAGPVSVEIPVVLSEHV